MLSLCAFALYLQDTKIMRCCVCDCLYQNSNNMVNVVTTMLSIIVIGPLEYSLRKCDDDIYGNLCLFCSVCFFISEAKNIAEKKNMFFLFGASSYFYIFARYNTFKWLVRRTHLIKIHHNKKGRKLKMDRANMKCSKARKSTWESMFAFCENMYVRMFAFTEINQKRKILNIFFLFFLRFFPCQFLEKCFSMKVATSTHSLTHSYFQIMMFLLQPIYFTL